AHLTHRIGRRSDSAHRHARPGNVKASRPPSRAPDGPPDFQPLQQPGAPPSPARKFVRAPLRELQSCRGAPSSAALAATALAMRSSMRNVEPFSGVLCAVSEPPKLSTNDLEMLSPSP